MSRRKAILGVFLVFFMGVVCGIILSGKFIEFRVRRAISSDVAEIRHMIERRLAQTLSLTPAQTRELTPVLSTGQEEIEHIRASSKPQIHATIERIRIQIRSLLTPEQAARYDALIAEWRSAQNPQREMSD